MISVYILSSKGGVYSMTCVHVWWEGSVHIYNPTLLLLYIYIDYLQILIDSN